MIAFIRGVMWGLIFWTCAIALWLAYSTDAKAGNDDALRIETSRFETTILAREIARQQSYIDSYRRPQMVSPRSIPRGKAPLVSRDDLEAACGAEPEAVCMHKFFNDRFSR